MSPELIVSVVAAAIALLSAAFAGASFWQAKRSADAAEAQVAGMRETNIAAAQPYVWADVQLDQVDGYVLNLVLGNSGPTFAENVRVNFDPPLPREAWADHLTSNAITRLREGVGSLAPGRTVAWSLGGSPQILESSQPQVHRVTVDADGPFGPVPTFAYVIDLSDYREMEAQPAGSIYELTRAVGKVAAALKRQS